MFKKFNFDYDFKNDSLFLFNPKSKSKASVEFDDLIIDFNSKKELVGVEFLNASKFFIDLGESIDKDLLNDIKDCKIDVLPKNNFLVIKLFLSFGSNKQFIAPVIIPSINEPSPAIA